MTSRTIGLKGYGKIILLPINLKDKEYETVDSQGNALTKEMVGQRAKTVYKTKDGVEISARQICKKFKIDGEELIAPKMMPTSEVEQEDIEILEENSMIYSAIDRKIYGVVTDDNKIKDLILKENKTLKFPFIGGLGWKAYNGILTAWKDKIILMGCRGDINEALDAYHDDTVDFEIDILPQGKTAKKLIKAIAY